MLENFRLIKDSLGKDRKYVEKQVEEESKWAKYDSRLEEFNTTFYSVLPDGYKSLESYLKYRLYNKAGNLIGIEIGGPGSNLFYDLYEITGSRKPFKKSAGFVLKNLHLQDKRDKSINHDVVAIHSGFSLEGRNQIKAWLGKGEKVDLLIERMLGPVRSVPNNPEYLFLQLNAWYKLLNEKGILLVTGPAQKENLFEVTTWFEKLKLCRGLDVQTNSIHKGRSIVLRIEKLDGAPEELPANP